MRKTLAFRELLDGHYQAQIDLVCLSDRFRRHAVVQVVQHRLNRHTRLNPENWGAMQVAWVVHGEIELRPVHIGLQNHSSLSAKSAWMAIANRRSRMSQARAR